MSEQDNSLRTEEAGESGLLLSVEPIDDRKYYAKPGDDSSDSDTDLSDVVGGDSDDSDMGDGSDGDTTDGNDGDSSDDGGILSDSDSSDSDSDGGDATTR